MLTLLLACCFTISTAVDASEDNHPYAALEWQPVLWFVVYSSAALLLLLLVTATCATRRERAESKGLLGVDLVERGVLHGERPGGLCEWLARRWPWSPAPRRSPQLSQLRMGLARSTHPLLCYELVEKRHVHTARGAVCVIRTDLKCIQQWLVNNSGLVINGNWIKGAMHSSYISTKNTELQEQAEKESVTRTSRGSTDSGDVTGRVSYDSQRGSGSGSPTERLGSAIGNPVVQLGTVEPVQSGGQPLFATMKPLGYMGQHVSWSQPTQNITSDAEFLREGRVQETLPEDIPKDSVTITGDSNQSLNQISETNFTLDVKNNEKWGTESKTIRLSGTDDTVGRDKSQPSVNITEQIPQASQPFKNVIKAKCHFEICAEEGKKSEGNQEKQNLLSQHKMESASDLEQSSESDTLGEISGSSEDFPIHQPSYKQSQEANFMLLDKMKLDNPADDPESSLSQEEVPTATDNTIKQSPGVYMSVLDKDASKLPKHTLPTEELEDTDNVSAGVSSCFLHDVAIHSQQERSQFDKENRSKSVQYISLPPEKEYSVQHLQYQQQTEYQVAPASVVSTNRTAFSASKTKWGSAKRSETSIIAEEVPVLQTSWDLLHTFPCHIDTVKMQRMDTSSELHPISDSYNRFKQHNAHSVYQKWKGDNMVATKQQETCNKEGIASDSRHKCSMADQHTSTVQPLRYAYKPVSHSETTEQQHCPLTISTNADEHHKVLQWRIRVSPHLGSNNKRQTKNSRAEAD